MLQQLSRGQTGRLCRYRSRNASSSPSRHRSGEGADNGSEPQTTRRALVRPAHPPSPTNLFPGAPTSATRTTRGAPLLRRAASPSMRFFLRQAVIRSQNRGLESPGRVELRGCRLRGHGPVLTRVELRVLGAAVVRLAAGVRAAGQLRVGRGAAAELAGLAGGAVTAGGAGRRVRRRVRAALVHRVVARGPAVGARLLHAVAAVRPGVGGRGPVVAARGQHQAQQHDDLEDAARELLGEGDGGAVGGDGGPVDDDADDDVRERADEVEGEGDGKQDERDLGNALGSSKAGTRRGQGCTLLKLELRR